MTANIFKSIALDLESTRRVIFNELRNSHIEKVGGVIDKKLVSSYRGMVALMGKVQRSVPGTAYNFGI